MLAASNRKGMEIKKNFTGLRIRRKIKELGSKG